MVAFPPSSLLLQWIISLYFTINVMVLGALLALRLALSTVRALNEVKKQREEMRKQSLSTPYPPSHHHDRTWRQQRRWAQINRKTTISRKKGGKSWM